MDLIPLPYRILGGLALLLAVFSGGLWVGSDYAKAQCVAGQVKAKDKAIDAAAAETTRREGVAEKREVSATKIVTVYHTIKEQARENIAAHPELNACGLDADGLRLWNDANSGHPSAEEVRGEPYLSLHRAAASQVGGAAGSAGEPHRGDGDVQPVPGQAGQAGGVQSRHVTVKRQIAGAPALHHLPQSADYVSNVSEVQP